MTHPFVCVCVCVCVFIVMYKVDLFRDKQTPQSLGHLRKGESLETDWLHFWKNYSNYFSEGVGLSRNWATNHVFMVASEQVSLVA